MAKKSGKKKKKQRGGKLEQKKTVKLVYGDDIRVVQLPLNCSLLQLREDINDLFPISRAVQIKYSNTEGETVTITSDDELRCAEASIELQGSLRLYVVDINPVQDPFYYRFKEAKKGSYFIYKWIIQFAQLFKIHVGLDSDTCLVLLQLGFDVYSEAMKKTVKSEEAQGLFDKAAEKCQEMAALALFNWGNVHMSRARKKVYLTQGYSREYVIKQLRTAYDWAQQEYTKAGNRYEEALKIRPDFFECVLALGQQQFEEANLSWHYAVDLDLDAWPSREVLKLYNKAEENVDKGMQMWEEFKGQSQMLHDAEVHATSIRSKIKSLKDAVEKCKLVGASPIPAVIIKYYCSNTDAGEGLGNRIDENILSWNNMFARGIPSFCLEQLLSLRISKIYMHEMSSTLGKFEEGIERQKW